jgi:hypothetical protein
MTGYLRSIVILSIISGIIKAFFTDTGSNTKKYVNFLIGLIMVAVIISPLKDLRRKLNYAKDYINDFTNGIFTNEVIDKSNYIIIKSSKEKICEGIKEAVISKYNFDTRDIYVDIVMDTTEISAIKITGVNIILTNRASWSNVDEVKKYTENLVGVTVNVTRK